MTDQIPIKAIKTGSTATALGEFAAGDQIPADYLQAALDQSAFKNLLINGDFAINQEGFAGGALSAGVYGYDQWKAGTGGCNVTLSGDVLTHTSGPLVQVIEAPRLAGKTVSVSVEDPSGSVTVNVDGVTGTITAGSGRRAVSVAVPSGSTGNVTLTITATGVTYKRVQLEVGAAATAWEQRPVAIEMTLCLRHFFALSGVGGSLFAFSGFATSTTTLLIVAAFPEAMRITPACTTDGLIAAQTPVGATTTITLTGTALGKYGGNVSFSGSSFTSGVPLCLRLNAGVYIKFDARF